MPLVDLTILSYHKFTELPDNYPFSRTYYQFGHDIEKKVYDWITIDDGMKCMIKACEMMRENNIRAKLFVCTSLVGKKGYCTWDELRELSRWHDIENHSYNHCYFDQMTGTEQFEEIRGANQDIREHNIRQPKYFVPPYNTFNEITEQVCDQLGLTLLRDRITIKNDSK